MLRVLTFSSLYPNTAQPNHGVFVEERLRHLLASGAVAAQVVAPVPWFPSANRLLGRYGIFASVPAYERRQNIDVHHPRFITLPKIGMRPAPRLMERGTRRLVARVAAHSSTELIDAHYLFPDGIAAARHAARLRIPYVLTARGSDVNLIGEIGWCRRAMRQAIDDAALTITVSDALRERILAWGAAPARVAVVRNGVDFTRFAVPQRELRNDAAGTRNLALLSVGKLDENKGHHLVIDAVCSLPEATLTIVGEGPMRAMLTKQIRSRGLDERVRLVGPVPHADLPRYFAAADVLVLASGREGMPNVVLESLACGTPVVATRIGGIPEVVDRPELGELVTSRDGRTLAEAIRAVRSRPVERQQIRQLIRRFDSRGTSERLLELMTQAAGK